MIKVCHIVNLITGKSDGVYAHLKSIFWNYDRNKFEHILIFQGGEKIEKEMKEMGIKFYVITSLKQKISFKAFADIYKIVKSNSINIIHAHLIKPYAISGLVNIFLKKKIIFNYHGIFLKENPYYNITEKLIYSFIHKIIFIFRKIDVVLVPSKKSKQLLMSETKLFPEPIVYYNGYNSIKLDRTQFNDLSLKFEKISNSNFVIAVVGRLELEKRIENALELFKMISNKRNNLILLIFGDGILVNELNALSKELEIENKVIFFDYVPNVSQYFKFFNLLLFTSDWEGLPLTVWEAMANQLPIVAPDVGGFKEIIEENNCGMIYESGNLKQAQEKILQLIDDTNLCKELSENGKSAIETKFTPKNFITQIENIYQDLVER